MLVGHVCAAEIDPDAGIGEEGAGVRSVADDQLLGLLQQGRQQVCMLIVAETGLGAQVDDSC